LPHVANQKEIAMTETNFRDVEKTGEGTTPEPPKTKPVRTTKSDKLLELLRSKRGVTIEQLQAASGWQTHSVRGFMSGTVRKRMGLELPSETDKQGVRRYRIADTSKTAAE
jgi:hypothetical protein